MKLCPLTFVVLFVYDVCVCVCVFFFGGGVISIINL